LDFFSKTYIFHPSSENIVYQIKTSRLIITASTFSINRYQVYKFQRLLIKISFQFKFSILIIIKYRTGLVKTF